MAKGSDFNVTVIGAGAVGLVCAATLGAAGLSVLALEAEATPGTGTSSRNSEVIQSGLHYPNGSRKHPFCVRGRRPLYPFLEARGIRYRKSGKLVVATSPGEIEAIEGLARRAADNNVENIWLMGAEATRKLEPELRCSGGLFSPRLGFSTFMPIRMSWRRRSLQPAGPLPIARRSCGRTRRSRPASKACPRNMCRS